jgi:hypothetical protein
MNHNSSRSTEEKSIDSCTNNERNDLLLWPTVVMVQLHHWFCGKLSETLPHFQKGAK